MKYISKPDTWVQLTVRHFHVVPLHSDEEYCIQIFCIMKDLLRAACYVMRFFLGLLLCKAHAFTIQGEWPCATSEDFW